MSGFEFILIFVYQTIEFKDTFYQLIAMILIFNDSDFD